MTQQQIFESVLNGLMSRYKHRVPDVQTILDLMMANNLIQSESDIVNDHIAFRTLGVPQLGIQSLEKIFCHHGYTKRDYYDFKQKKLNAYWYSPPNPKWPRVFISELRINECSETLQNIVTQYTNQVPTDPVLSLDLEDPKAVDQFLHQPLWNTPTWEDYVTLKEESEYASWVIYNRYYLNHFTITVSTLPEGYNTIETFNQFLENNGITLNDAGGKVKVSQDGLLIQSSTVSHLIDAEFPTASGQSETHQISGSYVEFAQRDVLDQYKDIPESKRNHTHRRDGFDAINANGIFESTYSDQTQKRSDT